MAQPKHAEPMEAERPPTVARVGMTADEYLALPETSQPQNLIDGRLYVSPAPRPRHQLIVGDLYVAIRTFQLGNGGYSILSPTDCVLNDGTVVQPDVAYIRAGREAIVGNRVNGAPDLAIEVLSPGTRRFDRQKKLRAYGLNGVREAWLVDPEAETVTVFTGSGGEWTHEQSVLFGETIPSSVVDIGSGN